MKVHGQSFPLSMDLAGVEEAYTPVSFCGLTLRTRKTVGRWYRRGNDDVVQVWGEVEERQGVEGVKMKKPYSLQTLSHKKASSAKERIQKIARAPSILRYSANQFP